MSEENNTPEVAPTTAPTTPTEPQGGGGETEPTTPTEPQGGGETTPAAGATPSEDAAQSWVANAGENWRQEIAATLADGDESKQKSLMTQLERVSSANQFFKNYFEAQDKIRSGAHKPTLSDDPSDQELITFRKANNIPLDASGYKLEFPEGFVGDDGIVPQSVIDAWTKNGHDLNLTPKQMQGMANYELKQQEAGRAKLVEMDETSKSDTVQSLQEEWGGDYKRNINLATSVLNLMPEDVKDDFLSARTNGGRLLVNTPEFMRFLVDIGQKANPVGAVSPQPGSSVKNVEARLGELQAIMDTDIDKWKANPNHRKEYEDLVRVFEDTTGKKWGEK